MPDINTWPCECGTHNPDWATHCTTCGRPWTHSTDKEKPMTTPKPTPEPSDTQARAALAQIVGSDLTLPVWTGDWHQNLREVGNAWSRDPADQALDDNAQQLLNRLAA
ncbi:hypothetical protein [Streptomyces sp. NPDC060243]|uniref:hypothetical protein n=1 Tax=Streptomyces sp. NPDC060243 TaxID=3347081 RepID=UPI0036622925